MIDLAAIGQTLSVWALPVITAITLHEAAHGWMADRLGDDTARRLGRVSFNPIRHVDPFGTLVLPGILLLLGSPFVFGWAKPVPVAFHRLRNPKRDMVWVALAGPGINIVLAIGRGAAAASAAAAARPPICRSGSTRTWRTRSSPTSCSPASTCCRSCRSTAGGC